MGLKSFLKQVNEIADEKNKVKFDEKLSGIHIHNKKKIYNSYRLYDGKLIDINGNIVKEWSYKYLGIMHKDKYIAQKGYEENSWGLFDKNNKQIFKKNNTIHHDIIVTNNNTIITLNKETKKYKGRLVEFDTIEEYNLKGKLLNSWSVWDNLKILKKHHKSLTLDFPKIPVIPDFVKKKEKSPWGANHDYYHINSIQIIPKNKLEKKDKRFKQGNWLISCRHGSMIFILDKDTKEVLWKMTQFDIEDNLEGQHSPQMLENGNILIFDNGRYRKWSRIIELNPINMNIEWEYKNDDFFTLSQGYVQKLDNENLLITQSEDGRVFEITKDKEIVWEFYHPEKQNKKNSNFPKSYGQRQWIYRMVSYDKSLMKKYIL
ncbi:MAG: arylsulfotransferase family protein [Nanoarchaeota archaeon]